MKSLLLLVCLAASACLAPPDVTPPAWVDSPYSLDECSRQDSLCAVGKAPGEGEAAREVARQRAIEQIVSSILVSVQSSIDVDATMRRSHADAFWTDEVRERIRLTTRSEDLPGAETLERWTHPGRREVCVLVRVPRKVLLDRWLPPVGAATLEAETLLATAEEFAIADPGRAIHSTFEAYRVVSEAYGNAVRANVVARDSAWSADAQSTFGRTSQLLADTSARLAQLVGGVTIHKLSGDTQDGSVRGALAEPLRVRLEFRDDDGKLRPLTDIPVRFVPHIPGTATLVADSPTTDASGAISCLVTNLRPTGLATNEIAVQPAFRSVAPDLPDDHVPSASFTYQLPTARQTTVVVALEERFEGRDIKAPFLEEGFENYLSGFDFDVRGPGEARGRLETSDATLLRLDLGPEVDYLIRGRAYSRTSRHEAGLHWYRAAAELQIVHLETGHVTELEVAEVRHAQADRSDAGGIQALSLLAGPLQAELEVAFVADFVPPALLEP